MLISSVTLWERCFPLRRGAPNLNVRRSYVRVLPVLPDPRLRALTRPALGFVFLVLVRIFVFSGVEPVTHLLIWLILTTNTNLMRLALVAKTCHINKCDTGLIPSHRTNDFRKYERGKKTPNKRTLMC